MDRTSQLPRGTQTASEIWIVFTDAPHAIFLRPLRSGFRHCFAVLKMDDIWVTIDPLMTGLSVMTHHAPTRFHLPNFFKRQGLTVVRIGKNHFASGVVFPGIFTCVGVMKRLLTLRAPFVFTPWQLYKTLKKQEQKGDQE